MPLGLCFPYPCCGKCKEPKIQEEALWTEYLYKLQEIAPTVGINGINWHPELYPNLNEHKARLVERFNLNYAIREVSREDINQWMMLLQNRYDEIADRFNHAYKLYDDDEIHLDNITLGYVREILYGNQSSGNSSSSGSSSSTSKFRDTPTSGNSTINNPTTENLDTASSSNEGESSRRASGNSKETYDYHDKHVMEEVNKIIDKYRQLDSEFTREFNEMFIGIMGVWC